MSLSTRTRPFGQEGVERMFQSREKGSREAQRLQQEAGAGHIHNSLHLPLHSANTPINRVYVSRQSGSNPISAMMPASYHWHHLSGREGCRRTGPCAPGKTRRRDSALVHGSLSLNPDLAGTESRVCSARIW